MEGLTPDEQLEYDQACAVVEAYRRITGGGHRPSKFTDRELHARFKAATATKRRLYDLASYRTKGSRKK